ncbi:MAG: chemotaxis protein CheA [Anaerolineae bacterium]|nr:chemotaxis protein CheA [Anaerolineae bacterium]
MSEYKDLFLSESQEHLQAMNQHLLALEQRPDDEEAMNSVFRAAHTLKGMASTMGYEQMAGLAHALEDLLDAVRQRRLLPSPAWFDLAFGAADALQTLLNDIAGDQPPSIDAEGWVERLRSFLTRGQPQEAGPAAPAAPTAGLPGAPAGPAGLIRLKIFLDANSSLKGARAYSLLRQLEELGRVVDSMPHADDLTRIDWGTELVVFLLTELPAEQIVEVLRAAPDVVHVEAHSTVETAEPAGEPARSTAAEAPVPSAPGAPPAEAAGAGMVRIRLQHLDHLLNLVGELVISRSRLWQAAEQNPTPALMEALEDQTRLLNELRDAVLASRLVPIGQIFDRFPRMVRDLLKQQGKEARFIIEGRDMELDRAVVERLSDPLLHLLRNAVDHGLEPPAERLAAGKPAEGLIRLSARPEQDMAVIEVSDDGRGLNREIIEQTAVARGIITPEQLHEMTDEQVFLLICDPRFSTNASVTQVSGRGVGMSVVKQAMDELRGELEILSRPGKGTTFRLRLPITIALTEALLVQAGPDQYAIPLNYINRLVEVGHERIGFLGNKRVLNLERTIPLLSLPELLGTFSPAGPANGSTNGRAYVILTGRGRQEVGVLVDRVLGKDEIVVKPLKGILRSVPGLAGATILGDGRVVLILDLANLIQRRR